MAKDIPRDGCQGCRHTRDDWVALLGFDPYPWGLVYIQDTPRTRR
jgi:hypothetical protein